MGTDPRQYAGGGGEGRIVHGIGGIARRPDAGYGGRTPWIDLHERPRQPVLMVTTEHRGQRRGRLRPWCGEQRHQLDHASVRQPDAVKRRPLAKQFDDGRSFHGHAPVGECMEMVGLGLELSLRKIGGRPQSGISTA